MTIQAIGFTAKTGLSIRERCIPVRKQTVVLRCFLLTLQQSTKFSSYLLHPLVPSDATVWIYERNFFSYAARRVVAIAAVGVELIPGLIMQYWRLLTVRTC
jgi:hypothetical protein